MAEHQFISPNWHVLLIHFPLGLLVTGVLLEVLAWCLPRERRDAMHWPARLIIFIGALTSLPTAYAGIYAFRDALQPEVASVTLMAWPDVVQNAPWHENQWEFIETHAWWNGGATAIVVLATLTWFAASDTWRARLYWPLFLLLLFGVAAMVIGSWFSGEAVYRYATAVEPPESAPVAGTTLLGSAGEAVEHQHAAGEDDSHAAEDEQIAPTEGPQGLMYFLPPLQLHIFLAGTTTLIAAWAMALGLRSLTQRDRVAVKSGETSSFPAARNWNRSLRSLWVVAAVLGVLTAVSGIWSVVPDWSGEGLKNNLQLLGDDHLRLLLHFITGAVIVITLLTLIWAAPRLRSRAGVWAAVITVVTVVVAAQAWLGILMLYDGHSGPLTGFNETASQHTHSHGEEHASRGPDELPAATSLQPVSIR